MKRFVSILILVCGIFFSILTAVLTGFRKYRFYVFTKKTVEDIYEMMQPEKDTAEENTGAEQEWYVYTDPDGNSFEPTPLNLMLSQSAVIVEGTLEDVLKQLGGEKQ